MPSAASEVVPAATRTWPELDPKRVFTSMPATISASDMPSQILVQNQSFAPHANATGRNFVAPVRTSSQRSARKPLMDSQKPGSLSCGMTAAAATAAAPTVAHFAAFSAKDDLGAEADGWLSDMRGLD